MGRLAGLWVAGAGPGGKIRPAGALCDDRVMLKFEADGSGSAEHYGIWQVEGFRAAAPVVVVVESGSLWVLDQQGTRYALNVPGLVAWDTGEWVAYGSEGPVTFKDYWAPRVSEAGFHPCGPVDAPEGMPPERADS